MLRLDRNVLTRILEEGVYDSVPLAAMVSYHHVYYAMKKYMNEVSYLHSNMNESLVLWGQKIRENGGCFESKNLETFEQGMFYIAFMSKWQLDVRYINTSCGMRLTLP